MKKDGLAVGWVLWNGCICSVSGWVGGWWGFINMEKEEEKVAAGPVFPGTLVVETPEERKVSYGSVVFSQKAVVKTSWRPVIRNQRTEARKDWGRFNVEETVEVKREKNNCFITDESENVETDIMKVLMAQSRVKKTERDLQNKLKEVETEIQEVKNSLKEGKVAQYFSAKRKLGGGARPGMQRTAPPTGGQKKATTAATMQQEMQRRVYGEDYTIRVSQLPDEVEEDELREHFEKYGAIKDIKIIGKDRVQEKRKKNFPPLAFVSFMKKDAFVRALGENESHVIGMLEVQVSLPLSKK